MPNGGVLVGSPSVDCRKTNKQINASELLVDASILQPGIYLPLLYLSVTSLSLIL